MKITYPLSTLPKHIHSTICTINEDGVMCSKTNVRTKRERDTNTGAGIVLASGANATATQTNATQA